MRGLPGPHEVRLIRPPLLGQRKLLISQPDHVDEKPVRLLGVLTSGPDKFAVVVLTLAEIRISGQKPGHPENTDLIRRSASPVGRLFRLGPSRRRVALRERGLLAERHCLWVYGVVSLGEVVEHKLAGVTHVGALPSAASAAAAVSAEDEGTAVGVLGEGGLPQQQDGAQEGGK